MKTKNGFVVKQILVCVSFFVLYACGRQSDTFVCGVPSMYGVLVNCSVQSFIEGVSTYSRCNNFYLVKGIALEAYEYGRYIKLVEDLKGNFPKDVDAFIAWGDGSEGLESNRQGNLSILYNSQDVLIMLLTTVEPYVLELPPGITWFEKPGDYHTIMCTSSVLKLSGEHVVGHILPSKGHPSNASTIEKCVFLQK